MSHLEPGQPPTSSIQPTLDPPPRVFPAVQLESYHMVATHLHLLFLADLFCLLPHPPALSSVANTEIRPSTTSLS